MPKRDEVNYCPNSLEGQSPETMEKKYKMTEVGMVKRGPESLIITICSVQKRDYRSSATHY